MTEADSIKWALIDLLRLLDPLYGGQYHVELSRIAAQLGVALPPVPDGILEIDPDKRLGWKAEQERKMKAPRN